MREKTITLKFDTARPCEYRTVPAGFLFMREAEGEGGNIYVKPERKGNAAHNVTRPGLLIWPSEREMVFIRVF